MKTLQQSQAILERHLNDYIKDVESHINTWSSLFSRSLGMASGREGLARAQAFVERTRKADRRLGLLSSLGHIKWGQRSQQVIKNALAEIFADNDSLKNQFQGLDQVRHCNWLDVIKKTASQFNHDDKNLESFEAQLSENLACAEMQARYEALNPAQGMTPRPFM